MWVKTAADGLLNLAWCERIYLQKARGAEVVEVRADTRAVGLHGTTAIYSSGGRTLVLIECATPEEAASILGKILAALARSGGALDLNSPEAKWEFD